MNGCVYMKEGSSCYTKHGMALCAYCTSASNRITDDDIKRWTKIGVTVIFFHAGTGNQLSEVSEMTSALTKQYRQVTFYRVKNGDTDLGFAARHAIQSYPAVGIYFDGKLDTLLFDDDVKVVNIARCLEPLLTHQRVCQTYAVAQTIINELENDKEPTMATEPVSEKNVPFRRVMAGLALYVVGMFATNGYVRVNRWEEWRGDSKGTANANIQAMAASCFWPVYFGSNASYALFDRVKSGSNYDSDVNAMLLTEIDQLRREIAEIRAVKVGEPETEDTQLASTSEN